MNNKVSDWISIILLGAVGVMLIVMHNEINLFSWLVRALGIILLLPGVYVMLHSINVMSGNTGKEIEGAEKSPITFSQRSAALSLIVVSAAAIIFGVWMLIAPAFFVKFFTYLLASVLVLYGVYMLVVIIYFCRPVIMPWPFYITPVLFILAGIVIFATPIQEQQAIVALATGILLVASAINSAAQHITYTHLNNKQVKLLEAHKEEDSAPTEA